MEPTEVLAVIAALVAGFLTGRRSHHGASGPEGAGDERAGAGAACPNALASAARGVARVGTAAGGQVAGSAGGVARHVGAGAAEAGGVAIDAARGALAGAGFGFLQFRASRHLRRHPSQAERGKLDVAGRDAGPTPSLPGGAAFVLVTAGSRFHRPGCAHVGADAHEVTREEAVAEGRVPCRACNP